MEIEGVDIQAIDAFLASGPIAEVDPPALTPSGRKGWAPEGDTRGVLQDERRSAFDAYVRGDYSLAAALSRGLRRACEGIGFRHVAEPLAKIGQRRRDQVANFAIKGNEARALSLYDCRQGPMEDDGELLRTAPHSEQAQASRAHRKARRLASRID